MQWFRKILAVLAVAFWLPASVHCQIESIPGLEFLACKSENAADHSKSGCDSGCCAVEKMSCKPEKQALNLPLPVIQPVVFTPTHDRVNSLPDETSLGIIATGPPDSLTIWHFIYRTALPARAPSIAS